MFLEIVPLDYPKFIFRDWIYRWDKHGALPGCLSSRAHEKV